MRVYSTVQLQKISVNGLESCVSIVALLPLSESCYMRGEALFLEPRGEPPERFRAVWELSPEGWKRFRAVRSGVSRMVGARAYSSVVGASDLTAF